MSRTITSRSPRFRSLVGMLGLTLLAACESGGEGGGGSVTPPPPPVASLALSRDTATLVPAATVQLTATPRDGAGNALSRPVVWASSDEARARVNTSGLVSGVAPGTATITATSEGVSASTRVTIKDGAIVGAAGASITALAGDVSLVIPPNALSGDVMITLSSAESAELRLVPGTAFEVGPLNRALAVPATLTLKYRVERIPTGPPERLLALHRLSAGAWTRLGDSRIDLAGKSVQASISTLETFAVLTAPFVGSISIAPVEATLQVGQTLPLVASPRDAAGNVLADRDVAWSTSAASVATVTSTGLVTAVSPGTVVITVASEGRSIAATITVIARTVVPCVATTTTLLSEDFAVGNQWTTFELFKDGTFSHIESQQNSGGNPGGYRRMTHTLGVPGGNSGASFIWMRHLFTGATYDPSVSGEICELVYREDQIDFSAPLQVMWGTVVVQNNITYIHRPTPQFNFSQWSSQGPYSLKSSDFTPAGLDFSATAKPIQFGYLRANSSAIPPTAHTVVHGIDNWRFEVKHKAVPGGVSVFITCTSPGQLCDPKFSQSVSTTTGILKVEFSTSSSHCADMRLRIFVNSVEKAVSGRLPPNTSTGLIDVSPGAAGTYTVELQAEGFMGGCNTGRQTAWAGTARFVTF